MSHPEQIDGGLAGKQRQFEGWIHNLNKELNHYKAVNVELSNRLKELCASASHPKEQAKGNVHVSSKCWTNENQFRNVAAKPDYITRLTELTVLALTPVVAFQLLALILNWPASTQWTKRCGVPRTRQEAGRRDNLTDPPGPGRRCASWSTLRCPQPGDALLSPQRKLRWWRS